MVKAQKRRARQKTRLYAKAEAWQDKLAGALVISMLCLVPLYINPNFHYFRLTWYKFLFLSVCAGLAAAAAAVLWLYRLTRNPVLVPQDVKLSLADAAVLAFGVITFLSALLSPFDVTEKWNPWLGYSERYDGAITQLLYVLIYFIVSRWYKPKERDFYIFGVSAVIIALIGIFQFYGYDFFNLWPNEIPEYHADNFYNILFRSTLGNINMLSTYVCVAILLSGYLFIALESRLRYILLAASALNFWQMEVAGSDSGKVGLLAAVVLTLPFIVQNRRMIGRLMIVCASWLTAYSAHAILYEGIILKTRQINILVLFVIAAFAIAGAGAFLILWRKSGNAAPYSRKIGVVAVAALIIAGFAGVEATGRQESRGIIYEAREVMHGRVRDEFATNRVYIWRNALKAVPNNPLIGAGPDTFLFAFPQEAHGFYGEHYDKAHNEYIQILVCQGILGLVCYLVFLAAITIRAIPIAYKNPVYMAILAAFIGYITQAFFNINLPIASQMMWVATGLLTNAGAAKKPSA